MKRTGWRGVEPTLENMPPKRTTTLPRSKAIWEPAIRLDSPRTPVTKRLICFDPPPRFSRVLAPVWQDAPKDLKVRMFLLWMRQKSQLLRRYRIAEPTSTVITRL